MAWFDIETLNYDGLHIDGYLADLVTVYDHLRAVELAALGSYKTTGWVAAHGSPVSCGYPHFSVQHSTLGATNIALATEWLRSQIGVSAYTWDVVTPSNPRKTPVGQRTILDFFCAIGRVDSWSSGSYSFSSNGFATGKGIAESTTRAYGYNATQFEDCSGSSSSGPTETNTGWTVTYYDSPKYLATLGGVGSIGYLSLENAYLASLCFSETLSSSTPSVELPEPTSTNYETDGFSNIDTDAIVRYKEKIFPFPTGETSTTVYEAYQGPGGSESPDEPTITWNNDGSGNYWVEFDHTDTINSLSSFSIESAITAFASHITSAGSAYSGISLDCPYSTIGDKFEKTLNLTSLCSAYFDSGNQSGLVPTSTGPFTNKAYVYWTQSPRDYDYS